jgi:hypothetical protein
MAGARRMAPVEGLNRPLLRVGVGAVGGVNVRELEMERCGLEEPTCGITESCCAVRMCLA